MKIDRFVKQLSWRFLMVRILVNAIALAVTALVVPKIYFVDRSIWNWLFMALMLGILNALVKPILQFLTLQFLFVTFGLTIVVVNTLILMLLSFLFPTRFAVDNLLWAFVGGVVLGLLSSFLESLLGLTMPIVSDEPPELRQELEEKAHHVDWFASKSTEADFGERVLATELVVASGTSASDEEGQEKEDLNQQSGPDASVPELSTADSGEEPASDDPVSSVEGGLLPPEEDLAAPTVTGAAAAETATSRSTESVPKLQEEAKEDLS
jgi:putative membrane protein